MTKLGRNWLSRLIGATASNRIVANLPLQMALYFNAVFFPFWLITVIVMTNQKFENLSPVYQVVTTTIVSVLAVVEMIRLYLGFSGNLQEKVSNLANFWMLSGLLQFPLQTFLMVNPHFQSTVVEIIVQVVIVLLIATQLITGFLALETASRNQAYRLRKQQLYEHTVKKGE